MKKTLQTIQYVRNVITHVIKNAPYKTNNHVLPWTVKEIVQFVKINANILITQTKDLSTLEDHKKKNVRLGSQN